MRFAVTALVLCVAALLALGMVMLYSANMGPASSHLLMKQLASCTIGLLACAGLAWIDYRWLRKMAWPIYIGAVLLLVIVLLPIPHLTEPVNGARRWISYRGIGFQPSEVAKLGLIVMLAWYCERNLRHIHTWKRGVVVPAILAGVPLALIFVEPDRGTTILLAAVCSVVLLSAGLPWKRFVPPALAGVAGLVIAIVTDPMRLKRVQAWLFPEEHRQGVAYQADQAMIALGSGGWSGRGLGNGRQKLGFVPEDHTDFIFSVVGEELGLIATLLVVAAFMVITICGIMIGTRSRDSFGFLLGCGISFLIGFQAFINIGVVTSMLPNKGLPLPFISYGGSNLLLMLACVGILVSIARHGQAKDSFGMPSLGSDHSPMPELR